MFKICFIIVMFNMYNVFNVYMYVYVYNEIILFKKWLFYMNIGIFEENINF